MNAKELVYDGNYHCGYCDKVFRIHEQVEFIKHQEDCRISFKAGIKEVMKFVENKILETDNEGMWLRTSARNTKDRWQAKLKEWEVIPKENKE